MSNRYLSQAVGVPLTQCLSELTEKCPRDPIEWMAQWLYRYIDKELYFYEKALFLKDLHRMRLELARDRQNRQRVVNKMNEEMSGLKKDLKEDSNHLAEMMLTRLSGDSAVGGSKSHGRHGHHRGSTASQMGEGRDSEWGSEYGGRGGRGTKRGWKGSRRGSAWSTQSGGSHAGKRRSTNRRLLGTLGKDGKPVIDPDMVALELLARELGVRVSQLTAEFLAENAELRDRLEELRRQDLETSLRALGISKDEAAGKRDPRELELERIAGTCKWCLDCSVGLVCQHSVLGDLRARCAMIHQQTPEWWEEHEFALENLYDHEIYTTDFE